LVAIKNASNITAHENIFFLITLASLCFMLQMCTLFLSLCYFSSFQGCWKILSMCVILSSSKRFVCMNFMLQECVLKCICDFSLLSSNQAHQNFHYFCCDICQVS
jgi:hypothetical protein